MSMMNDIDTVQTFIHRQLATESCFCLVSTAPAILFSIVFIITNDEHMSVFYESAIASLLLIGLKAEVLGHALGMLSLLCKLIFFFQIKYGSRSYEISGKRSPVLNGGQGVMVLRLKCFKILSMSTVGFRCKSFK